MTDLKPDLFEPANPATLALQTVRDVLLSLAAFFFIVFSVVILWLAFNVAKSYAPVTTPAPVAITCPDGHHVAQGVDGTDYCI